jgi:LPXTG-motif cell wall-anchored protein
MFTILCRFRRAFALLGLVCLLAAVGSAAESDRVAITMLCSGPAASLNAAGYGATLTSYLQHKDGSVLTGAEVRKLKDGTLYLPKDVLKGKSAKDPSEARAMYKEFVALERATFGLINAAALHDCMIKLNPPAPVTFKSFQVDPQSLTMKVGESGKFNAVAVMSDDSLRRVDFKADASKLVVTRQDNNQTYVVKGLQAGDQEVTLSFGGQETKVQVKVESSTNWGLIALMAALLAALGFLAFRKRKEIRGGLASIRNRFRKDGDDAEDHTSTRRIFRRQDPPSES